MINQLKRYKDDTSGMAAAEFIIIFPLMFTMILGIWNVGNGLWAGQKVIKATHLIADLLARETEVDNDELAQAFEAGRVAMEPFPTNTFSVEVYSVSFDDDGAATVEWDEVYNTVTNDEFVDYVEDLGTDGSLVVRVNYGYNADFTGFVVPTINMSETVYVKGRQVDVVGRLNE